MRWRNGKGLTREIARAPAAGEKFAWRLSLAEIERDCDFSAYPGYRRALVLVTGNALRLHFRGRRTCSLGPARRYVRFEGSWSTRCAVPQGRCTDLSLIVANTGTGPACILRAPVLLRIQSTCRIVPSEDLHCALFALSGPVTITDSSVARKRLLHRWDTLLFPGIAGRSLTIRNLGNDAAQLVLLRWRPGQAAASAG